MVRTATRKPIVYGTAWTRIGHRVILVEVRSLRLEHRISGAVQEQRTRRVSRPYAVVVKP